MKTTLKSQLIRRFIAVIFLTSLISSLVGIFLIDKWTVGQAQDRVSSALNSAREILHHRLENIKNSVYFSSFRTSIGEALTKNDRFVLKEILGSIRKEAQIDILTVTDDQGKVVLRSRNPVVFGDDVSHNEIVKEVLATQKSVSSIEIISYKEILKEGEDLAQQSTIKFVEAPETKARKAPEQGSAMVLISASPILGRNGKVLGVLYGGEVLNRNYSLVDRVRDILYQNEKHRGKEVGVVTLFLNEFRISTNFQDRNGLRAVGTRVSDEIYDKVLIQGKKSVGKALVIQDWYVAAYEPVRNLKNENIGILAVAMLEQKFVDMRTEALFIFLGITILGMGLSIIVANFFSNTVVRPIENLRKISDQISQGDFSARVEVHSPNEIGELEKTFNLMASSLQEREKEIRRLNEQRLMRSEKLASIGRLAAGLAHEINNPLTSVLTFSSMLLRKAEERAKEKLEIIVKETTRCREIVRGLLNFARQNEPRKEMCDVNRIIEGALTLTKNHLRISGNMISVEKELGDLPGAHLDPDQILEVFVNILINAVDAMPQGGTLRVTTRKLEAEPSVEIRITDSGHGIAPENLDKIFDPFFTTKEAEKGTGLGLAVCHGIVERHNGTIDVESEVGKGTTFIIKLPLE
jgi:two-component system NtrC family sensor kinase